MKRGFLPPMIILLLIFLFIMMLPLLLAWIFPEFGWLLKVYFSIIIFSFVRRILGGGIMTYIVSGILIYIFVFQLFWLFTPVYMLYLIVGMGLSGILVFGLPGRGMGRRSGVARQ
jgi:hypothetical protein